MNRSTTKKVNKDGIDGKIGNGIRLQFDRESVSFGISIFESAIEKNDPCVYVRDGNGNVLNKIHFERKTSEGETAAGTKFVNLSDCGLNILDDFIVTSGNGRLESVDRDYVLFQGNGQCVENLRRGINFIARKPNVKVQGRFSTLHEDDNLIIDVLCPERGDSVVINNVEHSVYRPWGDFFEICDNELGIICKDQDGKEFNLYSAHPSVSLECGEDELNALRLTVWKDGSEIKELDFGKCRESLPPGYKVSFGDGVRVNMNMETILRGYGEGVYKFGFNRDQEPLEYLCIPGFTYVFDSKEYAGTKGYLTVNWNLDDRVEFDSNSEDAVTFPFETNGGKIYEMSAEIPSFRYSFDGKDWLIFDSKRYCIADLDSDALYIRTPDGSEGYLTVSVPDVKLLKGTFEDGVNVFDMREISSVAECSEDYGFCLHFNQSFDGKTKKIFPVSMNAGYVIENGCVRATTELAENVSRWLTVEYEGGRVVTLPFENRVAVFDEEGFECITVQEISADGSGNENVKNIILVPGEIVLELDGSKIKRRELPCRITYRYGNYEGEVNPEYFKSMIVDERYSDSRGERELGDMFLKNAYGERMPDMMARRLFAEIEAQILKIQTDSECKHSLIRLFNKYVNVRRDFAKTVLDRLETLYPDDSTLQHLMRYL